MDLYVAIIDLVGLIANLVAITIILIYWKRIFRKETKVILLFLLGLVAFHNLSNFLEWSDITTHLDPYSDTLEILEPFVWMLFSYSFIQRTIQKKLRNGKEVLKEKSEHNEFLIDLITHDLSNYNHIILGFSQLLMEITDDKDIIELSENIMKVSMKSSMLMANVKLYSLLADQKIESEEVNLKQMIETSKETIEQVFPEEMIRLKLEIKEEDNIIVTTVLFKHVITNLISNAVRFKKEEQKEVKIEIKITKEENKLKIMFMDEGKGIKDEDKERVFERLMSTDIVRTDAGIGLSLVKKIIEREKGKVWVENRPESKNDHTKGTVIKIEIPLL